MEQTKISSLYNVWKYFDPTLLPIPNLVLPNRGGAADSTLVDLNNGEEFNIQPVLMIL
ncbi:MAG: hypothetical protein H6611_05040 [Ignavibacteriales bacterium]|nr:hypothetical protein [Ignavibacteriales bacterium]